MARPKLVIVCGGKRSPNAGRTKISPRPLKKERVAILESQDEVDRLCREFDVNDYDDIEDIVSGRVGEAEW